MLPTTQQSLERPKLKLFCFELDKLNPTLRFLLLCVGIFLTFCGYGFFQELIFKLDGMQPYGFYLTFIQFVLYSSFGYVEFNCTTDRVRRIPLKTYAKLALYTVATMGFSNASVGYLNYPTQVIFKCCKLIPVLIGGIIIQQKRFNRYDISAAVLMSVGLAFFTLADSQVSPNFSAKGYIMISLALVADAIIGNVQEKAMKAYKAANSEVVFYSYAIGALYLLTGVTINTDIVYGTYFFMRNPMQIGYAFVFSALGYTGIQLVLDLIREYGALLAVTVTTLRKACTIVISFILFAKPFSMNYVWSGLIVLCAIYLNVYSKNRTYIHSLMIRAFESRTAKPLVSV